MPSPSWPVTVASLFVACAPAARTPARPDAILRAQTQALLDAVSAGDAAVWERYLDPDATYLSEAGEILRKADLLAQIKPLPAGISGRIELGKLEVKQFGDVAVVVHVDEEYEDYFGQPIHAQYLSTATWRFGGDGWKLIATQVHAALRDPPAITLPPEQLDDYVGSYQLTDAIHYTIRRDGDQLIGERTGRPPQALRVELRDVLFVPGQPRSRKIFARDDRGRITRLIDRREARDIVWTRRSATAVVVPAGAGYAARDELSR